MALPFDLNLADLMQSAETYREDKKRQKARKTEVSMQSVSNSLIAQSIPGAQAQGMAMPQPNPSQIKRM